MVDRRVKDENKEQRRLVMKNPSPSLLLASAIVAVMLASIVMAGCAVGPNYRRPVVQTPTVYRDLREDPQAQAQAASFANLPWWQVFQDPQLQELIRTALKENYDLQLATERITAARAQVTITRSHLFPQAQGDANFNGGKDASTQSKFNILGLTADAAFQLDLFGRNHRCESVVEGADVKVVNAAMTAVGARYGGISILRRQRRDEYGKPLTLPVLHHFTHLAHCRLDDAEVLLIHVVCARHQEKHLVLTRREGCPRLRVGLV